MSTIRARWRALPPATRLATRFALLALPVAAMSLRLRGLAGCRRSLELLRAGPDAGHPTRSTDDLPGDLHRGVELASRLLFGKPRCLSKALVLERLARLHALPARLRFALDPSIGDVDAHAWIEIDGRAYGDLARYSAKFGHPEPSQSPRRARSAIDAPDARSP